MGSPDSDPDRVAAANPDRDRIVLGEIANKTGEPVFDTTLHEAMVIELEQSPYLSLISEERMQQSLRLMGKPGGHRADARIVARALPAQWWRGRPGRVDCKARDRLCPGSPGRELPNRRPSLQSANHSREQGVGAESAGRHDGTVARQAG